MGFGTEILFMLLLGVLVLGPQRLHTLLGHVARAKAQLEAARRSLNDQIGVELEAANQDGKAGETGTFLKTKLNRVADSHSSLQRGEPDEISCEVPHISNISKQIPRRNNDTKAYRA